MDSKPTGAFSPDLPPNLCFSAKVQLQLPTIPIHQAHQSQTTKKQSCKSRIPGILLLHLLLPPTNPFQPPLQPTHPTHLNDLFVRPHPLRLRASLLSDLYPARGTAAIQTTTVIMASMLPGTLWYRRAWLGL